MDAEDKRFDARLEEISERLARELDGGSDGEKKAEARQAEETAAASAGGLPPQDGHQVRAAWRPVVSLTPSPLDAIQDPATRDRVRNIGVAWRLFSSVCDKLDGFASLGSAVAAGDVIDTAGHVIEEMARVLGSLQAIEDHEYREVRALLDRREYPEAQALLDRLCVTSAARLYFSKWLSAFIEWRDRYAAGEDVKTEAQS